MIQNMIHFNVTLKDLNIFLQKCHSAAIVFDQSGTVLQANDELLSSLGYVNGNLGEMNVSDIIDIGAQASPLEWFLEMIQHGFSELPVANVYLKNKGKVSSEFSVHQLKVLDDNVYYAVFLYDLNQCYSLNLLQQFSGSFLRDVNLGVILINTEFKLVDISDMACRILGVERGQTINRSLDEVFHAVPLEHRLVLRTILDGMVVRNHAVSWMNNQERFELLMDSNLLKDHQGKLVGAYVIFKDVTNLRSLEQQVQRSDRLAMIGQIAAGTAHEIRNPLTSIKGFLQVLKKSLLGKGMDKEHNFADIMLTEIDRINDLVSEFLLLSKPKNIVFDLVEISTVLREILPIINNEAILHSVVVQYESEPKLPPVLADRELLKQVCLNICKNGIEAMVEGGILTITEKIDREEQKVNVEIHDTGPGIPAFLIDKIFDPFFTTKEDGTGLGLSVCQRIIHDIGGTIRVASKGYGTTFTISIPYAKQ